jgi:hypothetical protein
LPRTVDRLSRAVDLLWGTVDRLRRMVDLFSRPVDGLWRTVDRLPLSVDRLSQKRAVIRRSAGGRADFRGVG